MRIGEELGTPDLETELPAHVLYKISQVQSDWIKINHEQQFSSLVTESYIHLGLEFDFAILIYSLNAL